MIREVHRYMFLQTDSVNSDCYVPGLGGFIE